MWNVNVPWAIVIPLQIPPGWFICADAIVIEWNCRINLYALKQLVHSFKQQGWAGTGIRGVRAPEALLISSCVVAGPLWKLQELLFPSNHGWKETPSLCLSLAQFPTIPGTLQDWGFGLPVDYCGWSFSHLPDGNHNVPNDMQVWNDYQQNTLFLWLQLPVFGFCREMLAGEDLLQFLLSCHSAKHGRETHLSGKMELILLGV